MMVFQDLKSIIADGIESRYSQFTFDNKSEGIVFKYKNSQNCEMSIGCYILKYYDYFVLKGFNAIIAYKEVENIVLPVLIKHKLKGSSALTDPITISINIQDKANYKLKMAESYLEIRDTNDAQQLKQNLISFIDLDAIPFFLKWDIITLSHFIKNLNDDDLLNILGIFYPFKFATIQRLCNVSTYKQYIDTFLEQQKKDYDKDPCEENSHYFYAVRKLKEILDNTQPIYNHS